MKRIFLILAVIILAVIFETSVFPLFFSRTNVPDLILIFLVSGVAVFGFQSVWIWGIIAGFILDLFSFRKIGVSILSFTIFSYSMSFFSRRIVLGEKIGGILLSSLFIILMTISNNFWINAVSSGFKFEIISDSKTFVPWEMIWKIAFDLGLFHLIVHILKNQKKSINNNLFLRK